MIENFIKEHLNCVEKVYTQIDVIKKIVNVTVNALKAGNKVLLFGNGGSAGDAQHIAAELTGRYKIDRKGYAAIALTTDSSAITSISNDYGFEKIFSRQVEALAKKGDIIIAISTSGNSDNVINGLVIGKEIGCFCIGLSGGTGGKMKSNCDINFISPSDNTPRIQEIHILFGHIFCELVEKKMVQ